MKQYLFSVVRNASDTKVERMTSRQIRQLTIGMSMTLISSIRQGNSELKRNLPAVCWGAEFKDGRRKATGDNGDSNIQDSLLRFIDIDHVTTASDPAIRRKEVIAFYEKHILPVIENCFDLTVLHVQISPSGDGLHVVWTEQDGMKRTMEESQARFAILADLPKYDDKCKDQGRMLFLSPIEDTLFDLTDMVLE